MIPILDRHVLREFLLHLLLGLCTFVGIYLIVDLFEKIDTFVDYQAQTAPIVEYYLNSLPLIVVQVLPIAMLLAAILSLGHLRRGNEIAAMQSCGRSPLRITLPLLAAGVLVSAAAFTVGEGLVPDAYRRQQEALDGRIKKRRPESALGRSDVHYMGRGGRVFVARQFEAATPSLIEVSVQRFEEEEEGGRQRLVRRIDAAGARWAPEGQLEFQHGRLRVFSGGRESGAAFTRYGDSRMEEQADEFANIVSDPFQMSRRQLRDYIGRIREGGARVNQYEVDYHLRAAFPAANLVMVLLGSCLTLRILRGGVALGFGISLMLGFAYYGCLRIGQALGYTGNLSPPLAAWLGNIAFGLIGILLFWRVNR
ncbi:MAG: LptF/LptG family permease [Candidatus Eisenbacteria bacterium]|uniref:LptF/LptG family permease n=1 Tax=Eiseniibacteriota bacterium TaxID=2212470 RepID=A0A938BMN0_UNCEI|nr:LptF/LptG family permease [Candidatus Eisenbacteria bacterium]